MVKSLLKNLFKKLHFGLSMVRFFTVVFFLLFIIFLSLFIATKKSNINRLVEKYISEIEVTDTYFENYKDAGFTEEQCYEFLGSDDIMDLTASVMSERIYSLFSYDAEYTHSADDCYDIIYDALSNYSDSNNIGLSNAKLSSLTSFTLNISGIQTMITYDTPAAYRTAIFEADEDDYAVINDSIKLISSLLSPGFSVFFLIMYLIGIVCMVLIYRKNPGKIGKQAFAFKVCNSALIPSLAIIVLSVVGLFNISSTLSGYIFIILLIVSVIGALIGVLGGVVTNLVLPEEEEK